MILHVDMDAFYASVEAIDNPQLRNRCIIVGGTSKRGVVSAANYAARQYGVHSAMPMYRAKKRCPGAVFLAPRMHRYKAVSRVVMGILKEMTPLVEIVSIDEAYMNVAGCSRLYGDFADIGMTVKKRIGESVGLTCSVGIAPLKFLAKIASEMDKPDGLFVIGPEEVPRFIEALPVEKVPGVGKGALKKIQALGIQRLGDVQRYDPKLLEKKMGKFGLRLLALSKGIDTAAVTPRTPAKSISREQTLPVDTADREILRRYLLGFSDRVARDLRRTGLQAKTVTLKLRESDFKRVTRSKTLDYPTESAKTIYRAAGHLLDQYPLKKKVRLVGVGASSLVNAPLRQLNLFDSVEEAPEHWVQVEKTVDRISEKFGQNAVTRASLRESAPAKKDWRDRKKRYGT